MITCIMYIDSEYWFEYENGNTADHCTNNVARDDKLISTRVSVTK